MRAYAPVRSLGVLVVAALVAAACGGRLSEEAIQAELASDGVAVVAGGVRPTGSSGSATPGLAEPISAIDGVGGVVGTSGDAANPGPSGGSAPGASNDGGAGAALGSTDQSPSTPDGGAPAAPGSAVPAEGNGGATDVGVTETQVVLGNVSTLSGPVPGLFRGALIGTQAAAAYQNSLGGLFGRTFTVKSGDDGFDAGKNRSVHKGLVDDVFAMVGSFSVFDGAGASEIERSGVVDVGRALELGRQEVATHVSPVPFQPAWADTGCTYLKNRFGASAVKKAAFFWGNAEAARQNKNWQKRACESVGFDFIYEREFQATESNFTADVVQMRNLGVQAVFIQFDVTGIARFFKSLAQQGFDPPIKYPVASAYDSDFIRLAGADTVEGLIVANGTALYLGEDAAAVPEIELFKLWMARIDPRQKLDVFALYGWISARLLFTLMERAGPKATRTGVLAEAAKVTEWTSYGMTAPFNVAEKIPSACEMYAEVRNGSFVRVDPPSGFICDGKMVPYQ